MGNFCATDRDRDEQLQDDKQQPVEVIKEGQGPQPLAAGPKKVAVSSLAAPDKPTQEEVEAFFAGPAAYFDIAADSGIHQAIKNNEWLKLPRGDESIEYFKTQHSDLAGRPYKYFGQMKNGAKQGNGQVYFTDATGELVVCSFREDSADGQGVVYFADGSFFKGILSGQQMTQGTLVVPNKYTYVGPFINNKLNGHGKQQFTDGRSYDGEFRDGLKEGKGPFIWPNGDTYTGDWLNGKQHGHGVFVQSGKRIEGEFALGKKIKTV